MPEIINWDGTVRTVDYLPPDHYSECDRCGRYTDYALIITFTYATVLWCEPCAEAAADPCDHCDVLYPSGYMQCPRWDEHDDDAGYSGTRGCGCGSCQPNLGSLIHSYNYRPSPRFHGMGPRYLGMELELNSDRRSLESAARHAVERLGDLGYLKEDGSIIDGFEMVTHPMSYSWAMANFPWLLLDELNDMGCDPGDNCGIHVHVSRAGFTGSAHAFRWMTFFHRNARKIQKVARRQSTYARFIAPEGFDVYDGWRGYTRLTRSAHLKSVAKGESSNPERYTAINAQNEHTFEVRVFSSTLDIQQVQASLALVDASVQYAQVINAHDVIHNGAWTWAAFADWVARHPQYTPLHNEMERLQCAS